MKRSCQWCGIVWEASKLEPDPYFCPRCENRRTVWERLRGGERDVGTSREEDKDAGSDQTVVDTGASDNEGTTRP